MRGVWMQYLYSTYIGVIPCNISHTVKQSDMSPGDRLAGLW